MLRPDTLGLTVLLALLTALGPLSTDMYLPSLPDIAHALAAPTAQVQFTISSYLLGFACGQIVYGPISDRHGRKPILIAALVLFAAASLACAVSPSIEVLIAARFLQAFGGSGAIVLARAIVRDLYTGARAGRELSLMGAIMALAPIVGPMFGGVLQTAFGWPASFVFLVAYGAAAVALVWLKLPETLLHRAAEPLSPGAIARSYGVLIRHRGYRANLGLATFCFSGLFAWISSSSFVLQGLYGLTPAQFGVAFAGGSAGFLIGTALATRLVMRWDLGRTIGLGAVALALGGVAMVAVLAFGLGSAVTLVPAMTIYLVGVGLAFPQAMAAALTPFPDRAGAASSLVGFVQQTAAAALGALVGILLGTSAWPMAAAIAIMGCATLALWLLSREARRDTGRAS